MKKPLIVIAIPLCIVVASFVLTGFQGPVVGAFAQPTRIGNFAGVPSGNCNSGRDLGIDTVDTTLTFCGSNGWTQLAINHSINCGTTATCAATLQPGSHIVFGSVALTSASPSTAAITGISPAFTSASTYSCHVNDQTSRTNQVAVLSAGYVSGSAFTITGPNTVTDTINYECVGY